MELKGKVALVTGAAKGVGEATAELLAKKGADVGLLDINNDAVENTASRISRHQGAKALALQGDVSIKSQVERAVNTLQQQFGRMDVLVNNAGIWKCGTLSEVREEDWNLVLDVNLKGLLFCTQAVIPQMKQQQCGKIINIASAVALGPAPEWSAYCISKAAIAMLTQVAAKELEPFGIQVNALWPGAIDTDLTKQITQETGDEFPHAMPPEKVAEAVLRLVCPFEGTITGELVTEF